MNEKVVLSLTFSVCSSLDLQSAFAQIGLTADSSEKKVAGSKRRLEVESDEEDDAGYVPGGKGIHRNLGAEQDYGTAYKSKVCVLYRYHTECLDLETISVIIK